jgi:hypothetical protein
MITENSFAMSIKRPPDVIEAESGTSNLECISYAEVTSSLDNNFFALIVFVVFFSGRFLSDRHT